MRFRLGATAATAALCGALALVAAPAGAQYVDGRVSLTATAAYNRTITDAPYPTALTMVGPSLALSPSGVLLVDTPKTTHTLTYTFALARPFNRDLQLSGAPLIYSNHFQYAGRYELTPRATTTLTAGVIQSPLNGVAVSAESLQAQVEAIPANAAYMVTANTMQQLTYELNDATNLTQGANFHYRMTIDPLLIGARAWIGQVNLGLNRRSDPNSIGVQAATSLNYFDASESTGGAVIPAHAQIVNNLTFHWTRDLLPSLSSTVTVGSALVVSPMDAVKVNIQPTGMAELGYHLGPAIAAITVSRQVMPNLVSASVTLGDTATLRLNVPIGLTGLLAAMTAGYSHGDALGTVAFTGSTNVWTADGSLAWHPSFAPMMSTTLHGIVSRQETSWNSLLNFTRFVVSLGVTVAYPSMTTAQLPPSLPPPVGQMPLLPNGVERPSPGEAP